MSKPLTTKRLPQFPQKESPLANVFDKKPYELNQDREKPKVIDFDYSDFEDLECVGKLEDASICDNENEDVGVVYWYHKLVNPPESYQKFLDYLAQLDQKSYPCLGQFTGFKVWEHSNDCGVVLPEISTEHYNPADKFSSIRSSASRSASDLMDLRWLPSANENKKCLVNLDLTFPDDVSKKISGGFEDYPDRFWTVFKQFLNNFLEADVGTSSNLHLWSSDEPLISNAHFHVSMIWAKFQTYSAKDSGDGFLTPLDWYDKGKPVDLEELKSEWADVVNEEFGDETSQHYVGDFSDVDCVGWCVSEKYESMEKIVVNSSWIPLSKYNFSAQENSDDDSESWIKKKIIHRLKYCRRKPLTDLGEYYCSNDFDRDEVDPHYCSDLVDYVNQSRQFGFWTRLKYCVNVGSDDSEEKRYCPICGEEVEYVHRLNSLEYCPDRLVKIGKNRNVWKGKPPDESDPPPENERINLNTSLADLEEVE